MLLLYLTIISFFFFFLNLSIRSIIIFFGIQTIARR